MCLEGLLLASSAIPFRTPYFPSFPTPIATICATMIDSRNRQKLKKVLILVAL